MPVVHVEMLEGRSVEQKRELAAVFTREMARICECSPAVVTIVFADVKKENWSSGGVLRSDPKPEAK